MDSRSQGLLFAAIITLTLTISMGLRPNARQRRQYLFLLFSGSLGLWYLSTMFSIWLHSNIWYRIQLIFGLIVPQTGLYFYRGFLGKKTRLFSSFLPNVGIIGFIIGSFLVFSPWYQNKIISILIGIFAAFMLYGATYSLYVQSRRVVSKIELTRIGYLLFGGVVVVTFSLLDFIPALGINFPTIGYVLSLIYLYILSQTLLVHRLLDIYELIGRFTVLTALAFSLALIFVGLVWWVEPTQIGFFLNTVIAAFIILILFEPLKDKVERQINDIFVRERFVLENHLTGLLRKMSHVLDIKEMAGLLFDGLESSNRVTQASLYLIDVDGKKLKLNGFLGLPSPARYLEIPTIRYILDRLLKEGMLSRDILEEEMQRARISDEPTEINSVSIILSLMGEINADLLLPIKGESELLGLLAVRDERLTEPYTPEERNLFRSVAMQIGVTVENSKHYAQLKEKDRLAALGEMAAGLAHEIRNPLGAIKGASQILEEKYQEDKEFVKIIVEETERLNRVVNSFLDYSRPFKGELASVDVIKVLNYTLKILEAGVLQQYKDIEITVQSPAVSPVIKGDTEKLHQIFMNICLNSIESIKDKGNLTISIETLDTNPKKVIIKFSDTGPGIQPEIIEKIFIPFFTTKPTGTGLGLPICQKIIKEWGGDIKVFSELGKGASFIIELPSLE